MMWTLIKRDIWSTKSGWLFIILMMFGIAALAKASTGTLEEEFSIASYQFPFVLLAIISYTTIAHMCRVEEENGVQLRMLQLPISVEKTVLSRYLSSFLLLTIIYLLTFGIITLFLQGQLPKVKEILPAIYLFLHAVLLIMSVYLPFYFGKNSNVATWSVRLFFMFWLVFVILSIPIFHYKFRGRFASIPSVFYEAFFQQLFIHSIVFIIVSIFLAITVYRFRLQQKSRLLLFLIYLVFLVGGVLVTPLLSEGKALQKLEQDFEKIQLEELVAEAPYYDEKESNYLLPIQLTISVPLDVDYHVMDQVSIYIEELGFHYISLTYFEFITEKGNTRYFSHQFDHLLHSTEEVNELLEKIKSNKIEVVMDHRWLQELNN